MATPFLQTLRALAADRRRSAPLVLSVVFLIVTAWLAWFLRAPITVYEASEGARVESGNAAHLIHAPLGARIVTLHLLLGQSVAAGEVLAELDAEIPEHRLTEEQIRLARLAPEIEALRRVLREREQSLEDDRQATLSALDEGHARQRQAEIKAALLQEELARTARLRESGAIAELELLRARADAEGHAAESEAAAFDVLRQSREQRTRASKGAADSEELRRELVTLEGRQATTAASIDGLVADIDRRTIRAAVAGTIEDVAPLTVGAYVREGEQLGAIVPPGELRIVAEFTPPTAVGRVQPGQIARVRLDGYPWTAYGEIRARVRRVASEIRQGQVRVELEVVPSSSARVSLRHGMTGRVVVELEQATPVQLVLRAVGKTLGHDPASAAPIALGSEP